MATRKGYIKKSAVMPKVGARQKFDSIAERRKKSSDLRRDPDLLHRMETAWNNDEYVRREGERCHRFVYGDQWGDPTFYDGKWMTEKDYLISRGKVPLTINLLRRMITTVKGSYLKQKSEPRCLPFNAENREKAEMLSRTLVTNWRRSYNSMSKVCSDALENFLIRGIAVMGESYERKPRGRYDAQTKVYEHRKVDVECTMNDPLMDDISLIGIIHDVKPIDFIAKFGNRVKRSTFEDIKKEYGDRAYEHLREMELDNNDRNSLEYLDFLANNDPTRWRFYEIWTKEIKTMILCYDPARLNDPFKVENVDKFGLAEYDGLTVLQENERRRKEAIELGIPDDEVPYIDYGQYGEDGIFDGTGYFTDVYWYVKFLTPNATVIDEYVSPYDCGCPITIVKYPYVNGEVHSYISDGIPMQKYANRLFVLNDIAIRSAAKGALLVDRNSLDEEDDYTLEEIRQAWSDPDGVVPYRSGRGEKPTQVSNTNTNTGIESALMMDLKFLEDALGVHGASQGKDALSGQSGSLYAQQAANSATMLLPVLEAYREFIKSVANKKMSVLNQFYETGRPINTYGSDISSSYYDRALVEDLEYEITIVNDDDMETAADVSNQVAMAMFERGAMDAKALLNAGNWPQQFKEKALRVIAEQEAAMAQQQADAQQLAALQQGMPQQPQTKQMQERMMNSNIQNLIS